MDSSHLPGPVVTATWLAANLGAVAVADVRWSLDGGAKRSDFLAGHISSAVFIDLDSDLSDAAGPQGRHPLPPAPQFIAMLRAKHLLGTPVVCYDDIGGGVAARMWWMLDALGFEAAVLDGGLAAWTGPIERGEGHAGHQILDGGSPDEAEWPESSIASVEEVSSVVVGVTDSIILDARSTERFNGEPNPVDSPAGHMPGSQSRPWQTNLGPDLRFKPPSDIARQMTDIGVTQSEPWIATCGSGVTACHNLLAARHAGLRGGRLYAGSWSEWSRDPSRPVATKLDAG